MRDRKLRTLVVLCLLLAATLPASPGGGSETREDPRLGHRLRTETVELPLERALHEIHRQAGVELLVQSEMLSHPLVLRAGGRTVREVLEDLAWALGGRWERRGEAYLLLTEEVRQGLIGAHSTLDVEVTKEAFRRSFTPAQKERLLRSPTFQWTELTPPQQSLLRAMLLDLYLRTPSRFSSSILTGESVTIEKGQDAETKLLVSLFIEGRKLLPGWTFPRSTGLISIALPPGWWQSR